MLQLPGVVGAEERMDEHAEEPGGPTGKQWRGWWRSVRRAWMTNSVGASDSSAPSPSAPTGCFILADAPPSSEMRRTSDVRTFAAWLVYAS